MIYKDYFRQKLLEQSFPQLSPNLVPNFGSNIDALAQASGSSVRPNVQGAIDRLRGEINNRRTEAAAAQIHRDWMSRPGNEKNDWNAAQHVPYEELPEAEKDKDRAHIRILQGLISSDSSIGHMISSPEHHEKIADIMGKKLHNDWWLNWRSTASQEELNKPRMRSRVGPDGVKSMVDVNQPWENLGPAGQHDNYQAALSAVRAYRDHFLPGI